MTKLNTRDGNDYLITDTEAFKEGIKVIGKELEKQLKKVACFSGSSTVQTRRGGIEIKKYIQQKNTKLDQIGQKRSAIWKWERGIGNGDLDYDDLNSVQ